MFQEVIIRIRSASHVLMLVRQAFASGCLERAERQVFVANGGANPTFDYSAAPKVGTLNQLDLKTPYGQAFMYQYYFQTGDLFVLVSDVTAGTFDLGPIKKAADRLS